MTLLNSRFFFLIASRNTKDNGLLTCSSKKGISQPVFEGFVLMGFVYKLRRAQQELCQFWIRGKDHLFEWSELYFKCSSIFLHVSSYYGELFYKWNRRRKSSLANITYYLYLYTYFYLVSK